MTKKAVISVRQRDILKVLIGTLHYSDAVKHAYKLPESLIREILRAIELQKQNVTESE